MAKSKLVKANEKIAENVVGGYRKIEEGVVGGYKKIEEGVVGGYKKIEEGVVGGYKKIEEGAVGGFGKITDRFVDNFLTKEGESAAEAYDEMYNNLYELIISDIMMPEIDGFAFAQTVRQVNKTIPILFMSAKDDLPSKQKGFQLGIDDYMVKPIELDELLLRVRALLRRANIEMERKIAVGNLILDADGMSAEVDGEEIALTMREFNIIYKLLSYPKKTFTRAQLMDEFWGVESDTSLRAVDVYVTKLRDKLSGCDGFEIKTVRGLGYKAVLR